MENKMMHGGWAIPGILTGMITLSAAGLALGQEQDFVGRPGTVGSFERSDPVLNDEVQDGIIPSGQDWYLFGKPDRRGVYGWLDGGFIGNFASPASKFNGPYNAVDLANEPMMNQAYFIAEQTLPSDGSAGIGGRADDQRAGDVGRAVGHQEEVTLVDLVNPGSGGIKICSASQYVWRSSGANLRNRVNTVVCLRNFVLDQYAV
jgi:hypothetical protein